MNQCDIKVMTKYLDCLDAVSEHTHKKIEYVSKYVENYLYVVTRYKNIKNISFIDCMCNAGIYKDGRDGTPISVMKILSKFAIAHPTIQFNLFLNDKNSRRIDCIKELINNFQDKPFNLKFEYSSEDVNTYIQNMSKFSKKISGYKNMSILFVDPYNFGDLKIKLMIDFTHKYYSELLFNYFSSDYKRNINNTYVKAKQQKMINSMIGINGYNQQMNDDDVLKLIQGELKKNNIKFCFYYPFKIGRGNGIELYRILYATPNIVGLKKLKKALWDIFNGQSSYKKENICDGQLSLFNNKQNEEYYLINYLDEAKELVLNYFSSNSVSYDEIVGFVLENTMLRDGQIIDKLLKPLENEGKLSRITPASLNKNNYKLSSYKFL